MAKFLSLQCLSSKNAFFTTEIDISKKQEHIWKFIWMAPYSLLVLIRQRMSSALGHATLPTQM